MRAKANLGAGTEELVEEEFNRPLQIGKTHPGGDVEPFHLGKLGKVSGVDLVATIG